MRDNGVMLREIVEASGLTQKEALDRYNVGQGKPMALRTLKAYLATPGCRSRVLCPGGVLTRMETVLQSDD